MPAHRFGEALPRSRWFWSGVVSIFVAALVVSAAQSVSAQSTRGASKLTGSPIVTYTFADVNTQGPQYKNIAETARVYGSWINAHGGINGHRCGSRTATREELRPLRLPARARR